MPYTKPQERLVRSMHRDPEAIQTDIDELKTLLAQGARNLEQTWTPCSPCSAKGLLKRSEHERPCPPIPRREVAHGRLDTVALPAIQ